MINLKEVIVEALTSLGGSGTISEVREYIHSKTGRSWKNIGTVMADLCSESNSSFFSPEDRVLKRIGRGKYSLKDGVVSDLPQTSTISKSEVVLKFEEPNRYSFRKAEEILKGKGQLSTILAAASLTDLSSREDHDKVKQFFNNSGWDIEVRKFPVETYSLDAFKEGTGLEIERSLIDAIHRMLFRCIWAYNKEELDLLVFIIPTYKEPKFEKVKRDIQAFREIIPYPVYLVGVNSYGK